MADRKITDLTALAAGGQATGDLLTIVDVSESAAADKNKKITTENFFKGIPGDVGIGTSSPSAKLDVNGSVQFGDGGGFDMNINGTRHQFSIGGSEKMRLDSSGNLGVATTSPGRTLDVAGVIRSDGTSGRFELGGNSSTPSVGAAIHRPADNTLAFVTNSSERLRLNSSGKLVVGHSSATDVAAIQSQLQVVGADAATGSIAIRRDQNVSSGPLLVFGKSRGSRGGNTAVQANDIIGAILFNGADGTDVATSAARIKTEIDGTPGSNDMPGRIIFETTPDGSTSLAERMRISSTGTVKIGAGSTVTPNTNADDLVIDRGAADTGLSILSTTTGRIYFGDAAGHDDGSIRYVHSDRSMRFETGSSERMRILSNGTMLIGATSSVDVGSVSHAHLQIKNSSNLGAAFYSIANAAGPAGILALGHGRSTASGLLSNGDVMGEVRFAGGDGNDLETLGASIKAEVDGTPGSNDMPGRLVFSTTADGGSSPTSRAVLNSTGKFLVGKTSASANTNGCELRTGASNDYAATFAASDHVVLLVNRNNSDGQLIQFRQAGTQEGTISISGSTVSYNGGHLSRWSQLAGGAERTEILRGSVLSNLDEMCEWGEEDNEQLNRMKVSDVEGDPNVSGVFQAWDDEDDTYTNDFYCAMTGDFVIRIAQGTTVARGDLLMSAGDGTAKPQDDDIVRSKTIAKVTSTTVSTTYADGSYCVPCVLMAC